MALALVTSTIFKWACPIRKVSIVLKSLKEYETYQICHSMQQMQNSSNADNVALYDDPSSFIFQWAKENTHELLQIIYSSCLGCTVIAEKTFAFTCHCYSSLLMYVPLRTHLCSKQNKHIIRNHIWSGYFQILLGKSIFRYSRIHPDTFVFGPGMTASN